MIDVCRWRAKHVGHRAFKWRLWWQQRSVLQNKAMGVRDGTVVANAVREVLALGLMSIMMRPMNPAGHGCAERARKSQ